MRGAEFETNDGSPENVSQTNAEKVGSALRRDLDKPVKKLENIIKGEPSFWTECLRNSFDRIPIVGPSDRMIRAADRFYKYSLDNKSPAAEAERNLARRDMTSAVIEFVLETFTGGAFGLIDEFWVIVREHNENLKRRKKGRLLKYYSEAIDKIDLAGSLVDLTLALPGILTGIDKSMALVHKFTPNALKEVKNSTHEEMESVLKSSKYQAPNKSQITKSKSYREKVD